MNRSAALADKSPNITAEGCARAMHSPRLTQAEQQRLKRFWIRKNGGSLKIVQIKLLSEQDPGTQMFAAVLRKDAACIVTILANHDIGQWYRQVFRLIRTTSFAALILHCLQDRALLRQIIDSFLSETVAYTKSNKLQRRILAKLQRLAMIESLNCEKLNATFAKILSSLHGSTDNVIWIKGASLARSVYAHPEYRTSSDFDCVVRSAALQPTIETLAHNLDYRSAVSPSFCNQIGCGPTANITDFLLSPSSELLQPSPTSLAHPRGWPMIDLKLNPLGRGIAMVELERFFAEAPTIQWRSYRLRIPSTVDQLTIALINLADKERFNNLRCLFDIHLLVNALNETPHLWQDFLQSCKAEGVEIPCRFGLLLANDYFGSAIPAKVLQELDCGAKSLWLTAAAFMIQPEFVWNSNSLVSLVLSSACTSDAHRRISVLVKAILPTTEFLQKYYASDRPIPTALCLIVHWLVLLLPGGIIRRTFGRHVWTCPPLAWNSKVER